MKTCLVCGGTRAAEILRTPRLVGPLLRCPDCGFCFVEAGADALLMREGQGAGAREQVSDRIAAEAQQRLALDPEIEAAEREVRARGLALRLDTIAALRKSGTLLEIGASAGAFLALAQARGYAVCGVEPNTRLVEIARAEHGVQIFPGTLAEAKLPPESVDIAVMLHVIEHLPEPGLELDRVRAVLRPGGLLVVETPDIGGWGFRLFGARWRQIIPEHTWFFSKATLGRLLEDHGFRVREARTAGKHVSLRLGMNRLARVLGPAASALGKGLDALGLGGRTVYLDPRDVVLMVAERI